MHFGASCGLRLAALFALGLTFSGMASSEAMIDPPQIGKPRPAPQGNSQLLPLPPASIDNKLAVGGQDVKARTIDTRLSVDVLIDGHGPYRFLVDSGADTSVIGLRIAHDLQLPLGKPAILNGMSSRDVVDRVKVDSLTVGPTTIRNLELPALREEDVGGDGLIGIDALVQQRLMMDFDKGVIKIEDARTPEKYEPGEIVIIARRTHGQLILTHVHAAGLPLDAVIDTGSEISIGNLALRDKLLRKSPDKFTIVPVKDVTGATLNVQLATIDELDLGPVILRDVPIAFADAPPFKVFGVSEQPALLLGSDLLETFRRVSLDFRARKVRFQLRRCKTEGVVISTAPESFSRISGLADANVCPEG